MEREARSERPAIAAEKGSEEVLVTRSTLRCPFCHLDVDPAGNEWVACRQCLARHHTSCWKESRACGSCGEGESIAPRPRPTTQRREKPPMGSSITVHREGVITTYRWPLGVPWSGVIVLALLLVTLPFALLLLLRTRRKVGELRLSPHGMTITGRIPSIWGYCTINVPRSEVGAIKLERRVSEFSPHPLTLTVDAGADRVSLGTRIGGQGLKEPELEWLHEVLLGWKDEPPT